MKPDETFFKAKKKYVAIMIICFLYGGFSLILFLYQIYTVFWQSEIVGSGPFENGIGDFNRLMGDFNRFGPTSRGANEFTRLSRDPFTILSSPQTLSYLIGGIVTIIAGITIWGLIREKEIKSVKQETVAKLLLPDEKVVIEALKKSSYELTQSKLVKETGLNKVQVHRVIKRLEAKGVLEKHDYGLTNKIILKKEFFE